MRSVTVNLDAVNSFARASGDENPLHTSADYARRTPFGFRVAHGMLATLASLAHVPALREGRRLESLVVDFKRPVFPGAVHPVELRLADRRTSVRLLDGGQPILRLVVEHSVESARNCSTPPGGRAAARPDGPIHGCARLALGDVHQGLSRCGVCGGDPQEAELLAARLSLPPSVDATQAAVLLAASYIVGMVVPGENALFSRAVIRFDPASTNLRQLSYSVVVEEVDERFDLVRMSATFEADGRRVATAQLEAFVRPGPIQLDARLLRMLSPPSNALAGKVALVVGASRGLGAAIALALADQGARVGACYAHSRVAAERVAAEARAGSVTLLEVDAGDPSSFASSARAFAGERLDLLVCNASPPLNPLSLDELTAVGLVTYIAASVAMAAVPIGSCVELLDRAEGDLVTISSSAVDAPPADWHHYIAAKGSLEGLTRSVVARSRAIRGLVLRPPMLNTDFIGSPGKPAGMPPERVAAHLVALLIRSGNRAPRTTLVFDAFDSAI